MLTLSDSKIIEYRDYASEHGIDKAIKKYNLPHETMARYLRAKTLEERLSGANILILDIETAPLRAFVWQTSVYNANISHKQLISDWFMLSWSAKWLYDCEVMGSAVTPKEAKKGDDKKITKQLWMLFNKADIIIAHNGDKFDLPNCNTRFICNGLTPPSPYRTIDTVRIARKQFGFTYNKLDFLAERLGFGRKLDTDFDLWVKCLDGDKSALDRMLEYNKKDVLLLEDVYIKLRGWMNSHPNMNKYQDTLHCCSHCGSDNVKEKGKYYTQCNYYTSFVCGDCGAFSRQASKNRISTAR